MDKERRQRLVIAANETNLEAEGREVFVWAAVDVDTGEPLAMDALYRRQSLDAYLFLGKALGECRNKPTVLVDGGMVSVDAP